MMMRVCDVPKRTGTCEVTGASIFALGECKVLVSGDVERHRLGGWHLSISHPDRYPTWDEIYAARYQLLPINATFVMYLPPPSEYVNVHENCFHLWEERR